MNQSLSDQLQIWGLENDMIIFADGSFGFGLECVPVDSSSWSVESLNAFGERMRDFLNSLPDRTDVQFVQEVEPEKLGKIEKFESFMVDSASLELKELTNVRVQFLKDQIENGILPSHGLKVFVRRPRKQSELKKIPFFSKEEKFPEIAERELESEINLISKFRDQFRESLRGLGIESTELESLDLAQIIYRFWNPDRRIEMGNYNPEDIRSSLLFSDVTIDVHGFLIGGIHHRVISLKILPDQTFSAMSSYLRSLPMGSKAFLSVHAPVQMEEIQSLQTQRRIAFSMVAGKANGVSDIESQAKLADLEELLEKMVAQGEKVFNASLNIVLRHESHDIIEDQAAEALQVIRDLGGAEGLVETYASFDIFSQVAFPNARCKERNKKINSSVLRDLVPVYGPWEGHKLPRVLLKNRFGSLLNFDPFDSSLTNANQLISGGSGAGKSFATNLILLQLIKENPQVYFIDVGGSYKRLTQILGGQNIDLGIDQGLSINPFDLLEGEVEPSPHKIKFLLSLIEIMTKESGGLGMDRLAQSEIEYAIQQVYRISKKPRLSDLRELLLKAELPEVQRFGKILSQWTGNTPFGKFVDQETNVKLDRSVVAFDLKGLESYPDLQSVCLYMITDLIWRNVQRDRSKQKYVVFDECWKLLKNDSALVFIEEVFRTFRKYQASAIAISQDLCDFADSKIAGALIPNCSIKWILIQNRSDLSRMTDVLGLNANELDLIQSLSQKKGFFSEAFLLSGQKNRSVVQIEPTSLDLWVATTDPKDLSLIQKEKEKFPDLSEWQILKALAEKHPHGFTVTP